MKILITGAFGNLGQNTIRAAFNLQQNLKLICYDINTNSTMKSRERLLDLKDKKEFKTIWGDILDREKLTQALEGVDAIIHLAAILHPKTERNPDLAYKINVEGTENVIHSIKSCFKDRQSDKMPKIILSSSVSLYGPQPPTGDLISKDTPIHPTDVYTRTKEQAEKIVKKSGLPWIIFRITGAPALSLFSTELMGLVFEIPLRQQIEFIHPKDVGVALINAAVRDIKNKLFLIGGGERCQITNRELISAFFKGLGLKMPSEDSFKMPQNEEEWFYVGWLDTTESQRLLEYQRHTLDDFLEDLRDEVGWKRIIFKLFNPLIKKYLEIKSPYRKSK